MEILSPNGKDPHLAGAACLDCLEKDRVIRSIAAYRELYNRLLKVMLARAAKNHGEEDFCDYEAEVHQKEEARIDKAFDLGTAEHTERQSVLLKLLPVEKDDEPD